MYYFGLLDYFMCLRGSWQGAEGPSLWPKATFPLLELDEGERSDPNFVCLNESFLQVFLTQTGGAVRTACSYPALVLPSIIEFLVT